MIVFFSPMLFSDDTKLFWYGTWARQKNKLYEYGGPPHFRICLKTYIVQTTLYHVEEN